MIEISVRLARTFHREGATNDCSHTNQFINSSIRSTATTPAPNELAKTPRESARPVAGPGDRSDLESSMSYAMIQIGSSVGHLAAAIFSALAYSLRILSAQVRAGERQQGLVGVAVRSRAG